MKDNIITEDSDRAKQGYNKVHWTRFSLILFGNKIYGMFYMDAIPKFDIKSDISFDISIKQTTWILIRVLFSTYKTLFVSIWIFCNYASEKDHLLWKRYAWKIVTYYHHLSHDNKIRWLSLSAKRGRYCFTSNGA